MAHLALDLALDWDDPEKECRDGAISLQWLAPEIVKPVLTWAVAFLSLRLVVGVVFSNGPAWIGGDVYRSLPTRAKKAMMCNKVVSTVHAVITVYSIFKYIRLFHDRIGVHKHDLWWYWDNPVYTPCRDCEAVLITTMGYFIADGLDCVYNRTKDWPLVMIHHFACMAGFWTTTATECSTLWASLFLIAETSTVPLNIRWMLAKFQLKKSIWYIFIGLLLFATFVIFRLGFSILIWWHFHHSIDQAWTVDLRLFVTWYAGFLMFMTLNFLWFYKIVTVGWAHLFPPKEKSS